jgi:hypothetical protein
MASPIYRIVVPTRDSARWIGTFHREYQRLGVEPVYLFDLRSRDRTGDILKELGAEAISITPKYDRVECMLAATLDIPTEWVVRFDDDELPSMALIEWLNRNLETIVAPCVAISRRELLVYADQLCFSRMEPFYFHPQDPTFLGPQWRGFRPASVCFTETIHTAGFDVADFATVPQSTYFVHFDWLLRTVQQRRAKIQHYERQSAGGGWRFAQFYLPEMLLPESSRWTPMGTDEFDSLVAEISRLGA